MIEEKRIKLLGLAHEWSMTKHEGQMYALGAPYFVAHIQAVVDEVKRMMPANLYSVNDMFRAQVVAYLHDIVEDTDVSTMDIYDAFGSEIAESVGAMTKGSGETNKEYLQRLVQDDIARIVKKADSMVNLRACIITGSPSRAQKYLDNLQFLIA